MNTIRRIEHPSGSYAIMETARPLWDIVTEDHQDQYTSFFQRHDARNPDVTNMGACGGLSWPNRMTVRKIEFFFFNPTEHLKVSEHRFDFRIGETSIVQLNLGSMALIDDELPGGEKRKVLAYDFGRVEHEIPSVQNFGIYIWPRLPLGTRVQALLCGSYWQEVA